MAHPFQEHRQHHASKNRVAHVARGYARGGAVHHGDELEDVQLIRKTVKPSALKGHKKGGKIRGRAAGGRLDRKGRKRGDTHVNVMVGPQGGGAGAAPPLPMLPPGIAAGAPPMRPPMAPPMAGPGGLPPGGPGGLPPGLPPGGPPIRARGGRIKDGPAWKEGLRNGTTAPADRPTTDDAEKIREHQGVKKVRTFNRGGPVTPAKSAQTKNQARTHGKPVGSGAAQSKKRASRVHKPLFAGTAEGGGRNPFPHVLTAGSKSGIGRLEKAKQAGKALHNG